MVVSNTAARRRSPVYRRPAALAVAGAAAALSLLTVPTADAAGPPLTTTPAASAVEALTSPAAAIESRLPADFGAVTGYRPVLVDGILVAPHGTCSSPVPLPTEFETPCKAHDLGYDLLRYAQSGGHPLGPWARRELDRTLADRMRAACMHRADPLARTRCTAMAEVAAVAVDLNSRRQGYGVPVAEHFSFAEAAATWLPRAAALLLAAFATLLTGRAIIGGRFGLPSRCELRDRSRRLRIRVSRGTPPAAFTPALLRQEFA
ncbi:hypothetical protein [Nocardia carnea]|uniref:hypothetical protein n=1 Tax=Nocardia carnea TaxID=37328 RepID=UPI0024551BA8|nr:hypothetical protein [Nocardia carnea]